MTTEIKYQNKEDALKAVTQHGDDLAFCSPELRNDEEVVMAAIKEKRWAFEYASDELKSNKTFIMKALNEGVHPWGAIKYANAVLQSDIEVITLMLEKSKDGQEFRYAKGLASLNKELAAKALVKWGNLHGYDHFGLRINISPTLQKFFPEDCWYEKAQSYLYQLEQEKQAKLVSGGSNEEDAVVW